MIELVVSLILLDAALKAFMALWFAALVIFFAVLIIK